MGGEYFIQAVAALGWIIETGSCLCMGKNASLAFLCERVGQRTAVGLTRNLDMCGVNVGEGVCITECLSLSLSLSLSVCVCVCAYGMLTGTCVSIGGSASVSMCQHATHVLA